MKELKDQIQKDILAFFKNEAVKILFILFALDTILLLVHFIHKYYVFGDPNTATWIAGILSSTAFSITQDRSIAEYIQYFKEIFICLTLLIMALRNKSFIGWSILFLYFFADDMFSIHEILGLGLAESFNFPSIFGLRREDLGELTVTAVAGVIIFSLIIYGYLKENINGIRSKIVILFAMVLALVVFGVGVDMFDVLFDNFIIKGLLSASEDFGEMIIMSLIVWKTNIWQSLKTIEDWNKTYPGWKHSIYKP